ncbi:MAG: hypothetical protein HOJ35_03925 [Bdellovibrionales bacterium]|jgi:hypothetical protein|nr:hypothetical protein [Bdellovibrionales bacterium]
MDKEIINLNPVRTIGADTGYPTWYSINKSVYKTLKDEKGKRVQTIKEVVEFIYPKVDNFDGIVTAHNWIIFEAFYKRKLAKEDLEKIRSIINNPDKDETSIIRTKFNNSLIKTNQKIHEALPKIIKKALLENKDIKDELESRGDEWYNKLTEDHLFKDLFDLIEDKISNLEIWKQENYDTKAFPKEIGKGKTDTILVNQLIFIAREAFEKLNRDDFWKNVVNFINCVFYSELTPDKLKNKLKSEELIFIEKSYDELSEEEEIPDIKTHILKIRNRYSRLKSLL